MDIVYSSVSNPAALQSGIPLIDQILSGPSSGAIVFSGILGAIVATIAVLAHRRTARARATLDLLLRVEGEDFKAVEDVVNGLLGHRAKLRSLPFVRIARRQDWDLKQAVLQLLGHYELLVVGIRRGILDEALYKLYLRENLLWDWCELKPFIVALRRREASDEPFTCFQQMAVKWGAPPILAKYDPNKKATWFNNPFGWLRRICRIWIYRKYWHRAKLSQVASIARFRSRLGIRFRYLLFRIFW